MKHAVVFLICALIVSIDAHDHLKNRHNVHSKHSHLKYRANSDENNSSNSNQSSNRNTSHLCVSYNRSTHIEVVYNPKGKAGVVVDSNSSIVVIFSDTSGVAIAIYLQLKIGVQLRNDSIDGSWSAYLSEQASLVGVVESRKNSSFNATSPPAKVSREAEPILKDLGPEYSKLPNFINDADTIAIVIKEFSQNINSSFKIEVSGNFSSVVRRFENLGTFFNGSNVAGNSSVSLDLGRLLQQPSGIDFLRELLSQLPPDFDLRNILGNNLQSRDGFLRFLGQYDRFYNAIWSIYAAHNGNCSVQQFVTNLIQHYRCSSSENNQQRSDAIQNLLSTLGRFNTSGDSGSHLQNFEPLALLSGIQNSSDIINALQVRDQNGAIFNIVHILSRISPRVSGDDTIPNVFGQIISLFSATGGGGGFDNIIPSGSSSHFGSAENIVRDFIQLFLKGIQTDVHIAEFFISLPLRFMLRPIIAAVRKFFQIENLSGIFHSRNAIEFFIRGLIAFISLPISFFAGLITGFATAFGAAIELGGEFIHGFVPQSGVGSHEGVEANGTGGILNGVPFIGESSRDHVHGRHFHKERHNPGKGKKHASKEKRHGVNEKRHEVHYKKREIKEKRIGGKEKGHDVHQKKHEVHHN